MSFKANLIKTAIHWAPKKLVRWVANSQLKGIAELTDFSFDLETRKVYAQVQLFGEAEAIEVRLEDFAVLSEGDSYRFIVRQAQSNRPWLHNLLARIAGKAWKIPVLPQLAPYMGLASELFGANVPDGSAETPEVQGDEACCAQEPPESSEPSDNGEFR
jgi:hypothetical protein